MAKLMLTKKAVIEIDVAVRDLRKVQWLPGLPVFKFSNAVARLAAAVAGEVKIIRDLGRENIRLYDAQLAALSLKYCDRDVDGNPVMVAGRPDEFKYAGLADNPGFAAELKALADTVKARDDEFKKTLDDEIEIDVVKIKADAAPAGLPPHVLAALLPLIE